MRSNVIRALAVLVLALLFTGTILSVDWPDGDIDSISNEDLGGSLFGEDGSGSVDSGYSLIVVLIGLLLLVALLGGVFLAKEEKE